MSQIRYKLSRVPTSVVVGALALVLVILVIVGGRAMFGGTAYSYDKNYSFQTMSSTVSKTSDSRTVETKAFTFEDGKTYVVPVESAGRQIVVLDEKLPAGMIRIVKRTVPQLEIGGQTFDPGGTYDEVHYRPNKSTPRVTPAKNTPGK